MENGKLRAFHQAASLPVPAPRLGSEACVRIVLGRNDQAEQAPVDTGFFAGLSQSRQNHAAREAFFQALSATYGQSVASRVFEPSQRTSSAPLTPDLVRLAIDDAAVSIRVGVLLQGAPTVQVSSLPVLHSASTAVRAAFSGADAAGESPIETKRGPVLDVKHTPAAPSERGVTLSVGEVGDFGHAKFLARAVVEGRKKVGGAAGSQVETKAQSSADTKADTRSTMKSTADFMAEGDWGAAQLTRQGDAMRALVGYEKSGALEVDKTAQAILEGARNGRDADVAVELAVTRAMSQMKTLNDKRSAIYRDFLRNGLLVMAARVMQSDTREGCPLLTQLASRVAEDMDGIVGRAIAGQSSFLGKPHDEVVDGLASNLQRAFARLPRLLTSLDTQMVTFQRTIHDLLGRVEADSVRIGNTLLSGRAPGSLIDLHVTSSDPHHGGQRVMILKFEGAPETSVVYKPRDCRIDAGIVGNAGTGGVMQSAGALLNRALGERGEIGTYSYLLGGKDGGEYAFIECIRHQHELPKGANDLEGVKTFFRGIGQFLAVAFNFGITDIHQGNGMVSESGQMMFTDLEIAFSRDVLRDGAAHPSLTGTMMDKLLVSVEENDFVTPLEIDAAGLIQLPGRQVQTNPTRNFIEFEGRRMNLRDPRYGADIRAALKEGFTEAMTATARPDVNDAMRSLLDTQFKGRAHTRYHPIPTVLQLERLEIYRFEADKLPEIAPGSLRFVGQVDGQFAAVMPVDGSAAGQTQQETWTSVEGFLRGDFQDGDVAYFTRVLGEPDKVFHHDRLGAQEVTDPARHLAYDGLARSSNLIGSLRRPGPVAETKAQASMQPQAVATESVDARFAALPDFVRTAFDGFVNRVVVTTPEPAPPDGAAGS